MGGPDLVVVIPTRGRPQHVARTAEAWLETGAMDMGVPVVYALDRGDPAYEDYRRAIKSEFGNLAQVVDAGGSGMVPAINTAGRWLLAQADRPTAVAVFNDDHLPRSEGWQYRMTLSLAQMGTGIVYPNDLLRGESLCTAWAMTTDIIEATNRIVPCLVTHLFADNAVMALGKESGVLRYLPDVVVEHVHYSAGKAPKDEHYARVNARSQWSADEARFRRWLVSAKFRDQIEAVKTLRQARAAGTP